jgi:hypothetical protein
MRSGYLPVAEGVQHTMVSDDELLSEKRSPWVSLREALDQDHEVERRGATKLVQKVEQVEAYDPHVVHDEEYFKRLQNSASHRFAGEAKLLML